MSTNNPEDSKKNQSAPASYETLQGVYEGVPPIAYPNTPGFSPEQPVIVGGEILANDPIEYNAHRRTVKMKVRNTGDRPIQIGSHFHFFEVNRYMEFDRDAAFGYHLNIPATTAIRFEPGEEKEVELVTFGGKRRVIGFNGLTMGYTGGEDFPTYYPTRIRAIRKMERMGFKNAPRQKGESGNQEPSGQEEAQQQGQSQQQREASQQEQSQPGGENQNNAGENGNKESK